MIGNVKKTNEILNKYNLRAKKIYGQNFLVDENILKKIVVEANVDKNDGVLEIGPGIGALTELLLTYSKKVLAYEIDINFIEVLKDNLSQFSNLSVKNEDFLKTDLQKDLEFFDDCSSVKVISNLPYYITTPIIFKLLGEKSNINDFYFMVQKEVGERLTSKPNTKDYNALSVLMDYKTNSKILFEVSRNSFIPKPNVDSVVINIKRKDIDLNIKNESSFLKFIQSIFSQRRKTLVNNINSVYHIDKQKIVEVLNHLGHSQSIRSEALNLYNIRDIYINIFESPL